MKVVVTDEIRQAIDPVVLDSLLSILRRATFAESCFVTRFMDMIYVRATAANGGVLVPFQMLGGDATLVILLAALMGRVRASRAIDA